jgi:putative ABC transport system permease protein
VACTEGIRLNRIAQKISRLIFFARPHHFGVLILFPSVARLKAIRERKMTTLLQDLRYALRLLRKSPGFAIAAVLTLALGMGANTVMFSVLNTVLLQPLPYPQPDRLVQIWETDTHLDSAHSVVSPYNFVDWRSQSKNFEAMSTYDFSSAVLTGQKVPVRLGIVFVAAAFFDVMKVPPFKGRTFIAGEDEPGKPRAAVLSYRSWQNNFGSDPDIVGKPILLDEQAYSVVGVMPAGFAFPNESSAWCTPGFDLKQMTRASHSMFAVGRLKLGVKLKQAQAEMNTIAENLKHTYNQNSGVLLVSLQDEIVGRSKRSVLVLWAAVVFVLLIACANVAGLLLARAVSRHKEVAIRSALGGSRARLIQQFLVESVLLATIGGTVGLVLAYSTGHFVVLASNGAVPRLRDFKIDGWVLAFSGIACLLTGIAFGLAPALKALHIDVNHSLKESGATRVSGRMGLRNFFVVVEVALAMVLLIAGGLLTKTLWRLQHTDPGFSPDNLLTFRFALPMSKFSTSIQRAEMYERVSDRLPALPGVESVGSVNDLPFAGSRSGSSFEIANRPADPKVIPQADWRTVNPAYFFTMRMRLLRGREFTRDDTAQSKYVAVVNQTFTKKFFANEDPIGHQVKIHDRTYEIVGIVNDIKLQDLSASAFPEFYVCNLQAELQPWKFFVVRSRMDAKELVKSVRSAVQEVAPDEPIFRLTTMANYLDYWLSPEKFSSLLLAIFAGLALVLAAIGIYGVIAYNVVQRTREIGIRMALGAEKTDVLRLIFRHAVRIGAMGVIIGIAAAYLATRTLSSMLYGVNPHDPLIFAAVIISILVVILLASYIPARKATLVDPLIALRYE